MRDMLERVWTALTNLFWKMLSEISLKNMFEFLKNPLQN